MNKENLLTQKRQKKGAIAKISALKSVGFLSRQSRCSPGPEVKINATQQLPAAQADQLSVRVGRTGKEPRSCAGLLSLLRLASAQPLRSGGTLKRLIVVSSR